VDKPDSAINEHGYHEANTRKIQNEISHNFVYNGCYQIPWHDSWANDAMRIHGI
jgi:hypothetical protein